MTYTKTSESLPNAEPLKACNTQYRIYVPEKGYFNAFYAFDITGEKTWYNLNRLKITEEVHAWSHL